MPANGYSLPHGFQNLKPKYSLSSLSFGHLSLSPSSPSLFLTLLITFGMASAKRGLYHLHIELEDEYHPIRKRNKISVVSLVALQTMRLEGRKHLDLWTDGRLYPIDPIKKAPPLSITALHS